MVASCHTYFWKKELSDREMLQNLTYIAWKDVTSGRPFLPNALIFIPVFHTMRYLETIISQRLVERK